MSQPLRDFGRTLRDARAAFGPVDVYPVRAQSDLDRRLSAMPPRVSVPRPPYLSLFLACAVVGAAGFSAGWFVSKAIANAAATITQSEQMQ